MALSLAMYFVSATHWALSIALVEALTIGRISRAVKLEFLIIYLPTVNVRHCLKVKMLADRGQLEVHFRRRNRPVASLGVVGSQTVVVCLPTGLHFVYSWWVSSVCFQLSSE